jgi:hypothetical protein
MFFKILMLSILFANVTFGFNYIYSNENNLITFSDSLKINSYYLVTAKDGSYCEGILTGQDLIKIIIKNSRGKELNIFRSHIDIIQDNIGNTVYQSAESLEEERESQQEIVKQKDTTQSCDIYLTNNTILKDVMITDETDSNFKVIKKDVTREFNIADINRITFINHGFAKGLIYGELASVVVWGVFGLINGGSPEFRPETGFLVGFILGIPTGLIAGVISEFVTKDDEYNFGNLSANVKAKRLKYLIQKYKE